MRIRTLDGRVFILNDSVELQRVDETIDGKEMHSLYFVSLNDKSKSILLHSADNEEDSYCVYCQAVGLMRSRNTEMLDFEAMDTNPDKYNYTEESISWEKKRSTKSKVIRRYK